MMALVAEGLKPWKHELQQLMDAAPMRPLARPQPFSRNGNTLFGVQANDRAAVPAGGTDGAMAAALQAAAAAAVDAYIARTKDGGHTNPVKTEAGKGGGKGQGTGAAATRTDE